MTRSELHYCIGDYCSQYEIEITEKQIADVVADLLETVEEHEEYNARCGIHGINIDIILDNYFEEWEEDQNQ